MDHIKLLLDIYMETEIKCVDYLLQHIELVQHNCITIARLLVEEDKGQMARSLIRNGMCHDSSKLIGREWEYIKLRNYKKLNKEQKLGLEWAIHQHVASNPHHSEYWGSIHNMPEVYVIEMACDWVARATEFGTSVRAWMDNEATKRYQFKREDSVYRLISKYIDMLCGEPFEQIKKEKHENNNDT
jgi:hypothetical protein